MAGTVLEFPNATRSAMCNALVDLIDVGAGTSHLRIYTSAFGTLLAELDFANPAFGAASNGVATAATGTNEASAPATGTAAKFRIVDRDGTTVCEGDAGTSGTALIMTSTSITATEPVNCTWASSTVTVPAS